jgi:hypothetical protein
MIDRNPPWGNAEGKFRLIGVLLPIVTFSLLFPLALHAYTGFFSRYIADDFCTASTLKEHGFFESQNLWYESWSGRFSFTWTINLFEMIGVRVVSFLPAGAILLWIISLALAIKPLLRSLAFRRIYFASFSLAMLIVYGTLDQTPDVIQSLYWQTGMLTYTLPLILLALFAGVVLYAMLIGTKGKIPKALILLFSVLIPFIAGGYSETSSALQVMALAIAAAGLLTQRADIRFKRGLILTVAGLLGSIAAMILMFLAPGNVIRRSLFAQPLTLFEIIWLSLRFGAVFFVKTLWSTRITTFMLVSFSALIALLFTMPFSGESQAAPAIRRKLAKALLITPVIGFFLCASAMAPSVYGTNAYPPDRALIVPQNVLSVTIVVWGTIFGLWLKSSKAGQNALHSKIALTAIAVLTCLLLLSPFFSIRRTSILITPAMKNFASLWDRRQEEIIMAKEEQEHNPRVIPLPHIAGLHTIGDDADDWLNHCVASYYGLNSITAGD